MSWWDDLVGLFSGGEGANPSLDAGVGGGAIDLSGGNAAGSVLGDLAASGGDAMGGAGALSALLDGYGSGTPAADPTGGISNTAGYAAHQGIGGDSSTGPGALTRVMQGLGIAGQDGSVDYSDPKVLDKIMKSVMAGGNILYALSGGNKPKGYKSPAQLRAELAGPFNNWTPQQAAASNSYFNAPPSAARGLMPAGGLPSTIVPGRRYAIGGSTTPAEPMDAHPTFHSNGALSLVTGPGGGQDDLVAARLGPGEYVIDADVVSALGDGDNNHGAAVLDKFRQQVRAHKRAAPAASIPPKAKPLSTYLRKAGV